MGWADPAPVRDITPETVLCPYCGVPLYTSKDRADHVQAEHCCDGLWDCADVTDPHRRCDCAARKPG